MFLFIVRQIMALLDCINQISKYTRYTCCGKPAWLFSHMLFDIERELFLLQLSGENSVLASLSCRPGYRQSTEIPLLDFLKQVHVLLTYHIVLDIMNDQLISCKHVFYSLAVKKASLPPSGRPRTTTPLEVRVIVMS